MEWLTSIRTAIDYMEEHLTDNISAQDVADRVYLSPFFLQKGFSLMTGYGIGEYIRNRRLYQAARDLKEQLGSSILVCVGDGENDVTMLQGADFAYCPGDAIVADRFENVCKCAQGAVAEVIYKKIPEILRIYP